jgi:hypothetical protein
LVEVNLRDPAKRAQAIAALERQMKEAAANLEFELAALLRDQANDLRALDAPDVHRQALASTSPPSRFARPARRRRA